MPNIRSFKCCTIAGADFCICLGEQIGAGETICPCVTRETVAIVSSSRRDIEVLKHFPYNIEPENVQPIYKEMKGWQADLTGMTTYEELPSELKEYIEFIEKELEVPIKVVSVGPDRTQTITR